MNTVNVLNPRLDVLPHQPDMIDHIAAENAQRAADAVGERLRTHKEEELIRTIDKLNAQYMGRQVGNTISVGDIIYEVTTFATRTPDWRDLDEVVTIEMIYDTCLKEPLQRYTVEMLELGGGKTVVVLDMDGSISFTREVAGVPIQLDDESAYDTMRDLVVRAERAVWADQKRKEAAARDGLDPQVYSDVADMHARELLIAAGYRQHRDAGSE